MGDALIDGDPQRLGGYWLAGRVGEGGQGIVYEGYDAEGGRVAIKVLRGDPSTQPRLAKEATAARRVPAFCTARVLDADLEGPRPYIVSEYVEGPSLRQAARVFRGDELHRLATAMATALTAIHDAGVVHRDLKPDNVLLGPDGPRVIDFGVARTLEMSLTSAQLLAGTPSYMAPEVFSGERAGMPADVFAWGATVLFAATGQDPFRADSLGAVMHRVLSHEPDLSPLPAQLRALVAAALAKDPRQRPTSKELLLALVSGDGLDTARLLAQGAGSAAAMAPHGDQPARDPALGTLAEDAYAALGPAERELVPELFLRLVTVTDQGDLTVRQAARHQPGEILGMAATPSGRTLAIATEEGGVRLWGTATGAAREPRYRLFEGAGESDFSLSYSDSEDVVAVRMGQGATFWNTRTGAKTEVPTLGGDMVVTADGKTAVYTLMGSALRRQSLLDGRATTLWNCSGICQNFAPSPNGEKLAVSGPNQDILLLSLRSGKESDSSLTDWKGGAIAWSPDGAAVAALDDSGLQVWRASDATLVLDEPVAPGAGHLAFDPDGHTLRYLAGDTVVSAQLDLRPRRGPRGDLLSPDGGHLLAGRKVRHLATGKTITLPDEPQYPLVFSGNGSALAVGGDATVFVHDTTTGRRLAELPLVDESPQGLAFSPDGTRLAVSAQTYIRMIELPGAKQVWRAPADMADELAFTPDGRYLSIGESFLDAATGRPAVPRPLGPVVRGLGFSTDGTVFGWPDGSARMAFWRRGAAEPSSAPLRDMPVDPKLTFSPDGSLVTAVNHEEMRVYDVASGVVIAAIKDPLISQAGFSAGRLLVVVDGKLAEYPMDPAVVAARVCARAGRSLSEAEWVAYVPGLPYRKVCAR
ncbi:hypothetical protein GCM10010404_50050 [Nonomuraea africana]|uniref:WD40 repeat protein n=1 Tax=Nonomuraea africana TaxID=46171 RepID=A0ABR9KVH2_9ACTN|nr:protein kinase [Nonomuraea africana]MBE1566027.1 WD40 repeat protein [Nonomuraea africana]